MIFTLFDGDTFEADVVDDCYVVDRDFASQLDLIKSFITDEGEFDCHVVDKLYTRRKCYFKIEQESSDGTEDDYSSYTEDSGSYSDLATDDELRPQMPDWEVSEIEDMELRAIMQESGSDSDMDCDSYGEG